jgi:hypothetical protein
VYEEQVRTIGLLRVPGLKAARIDTPVSFVDVPPTLLNVLGLKDQMKPFKGRSLLTGLLGEPVEKRPVVVETWKVRTLANYRAGLIDWPYKIVTDGSDARLYDLVEDPKEKNELNTTHPRYLELVHKMDQYQDQVQRVYQDAPKKKKKKKKKKLEPRRSLDKAKRSLHHAVDLATPPTSPARFVGPQNPEIKEKIRHKVEKDLRVTSPFQGHREHGTQRAKTKKKPGSK